MRHRDWLTAHMASSSFLNFLKIRWTEDYYEDLFAQCAEPTSAEMTLASKWGRRRWASRMFRRRLSQLETTARRRPRARSASRAGTASSKGAQARAEPKSA